MPQTAEVVTLVTAVSSSVTTANSSSFAAIVAISRWDRMATTCLVAFAFQELMELTQVAYLARRHSPEAAQMTQIIVHLVAVQPTYMAVP